MVERRKKQRDIERERGKRHNYRENVVIIREQTKHQTI